MAPKFEQCLLGVAKHAKGTVPNEALRGLTIKQRPEITFCGHNEERCLVGVIKRAKGTSRN